MDYNGMSPEDAYYVRTGEPIQALADRIRTVAALRTPLTEKTAFELETLDNVPGAISGHGLALERGAEAKDIAYAVEKPWKYVAELAEAKQEVQS